MHEGLLRGVIHQIVPVGGRQFLSHVLVKVDFPLKIGIMSSTRRVGR